MSTHAGVEPVSDIDGTIRTDADVGRTELRLQDARGLAAKEVGTGPLLLLVGREEVEAFEFHAGAIGLRQVTEDDILPGFAGEQQTVPLFAHRTILVEGHAGGRATAVDITRWHGVRVLLTPFGDLSGLARALVGPPRTLAIE